ncbi:MAG: FMN-binding protein [Clostridia bacterium]|nr:FMN-binding protein [Clostridia bacterium]
MKNYVIPTLTLFIICLVAAALLGVTNGITAPRIAEIEKQQTQEAMQEVLPDAAKFGDITDETRSGCSYAEALDPSGKVIGYAVTAVGKGGYNGEIKLMVGLDKDGKVKNLSFLSIDETPSIGMKLKTNESFLGQFFGISGSAALRVKGGNIDAVSGATKTSSGITDAVNNALICYNNISGEVSANG